MLSLAQPALQDFEKLAPVKSSYFNFQLELLSHPNGYIQCEDNLVVKLRYNKKYANQLSFTFSLTQESLGEIYKVRW